MENQVKKLYFFSVWYYFSKGLFYWKSKLSNLRFCLIFVFNKDHAYQFCTYWRKAFFEFMTSHVIICDIFYFKNTGKCIFEYSFKYLLFKIS